MRRPTRVPTPQLRRATAPTRGRRRATLSRTPEVCSRPCLPSFLGLCFVFWSIIYCGRRRREAASRPGLRTYPRRIASEVPGREQERRRRGRGKLGRGSAASLPALSPALRLEQEPFFSRDPLGEVNFVLESAMGAGFDAAKINLRYLRYPISSPAWRLERALIYSRDPLRNEILCWSQLWVAAKVIASPAVVKLDERFLLLIADPRRRRKKKKKRS
ncbi:hypothetical protein BHE74_00028970 [Ensete ventricosum]|nr:hypothetical protein BHE74_00028970 [Ensete ventricosum]RZS06838.1 hypothetical protein BHM03_00037568 [Ensete ventricosum]